MTLPSGEPLRSRRLCLHGASASFPPTLRTEQEQGIIVEPHSPGALSALWRKARTAFEQIATPERTYSGLDDAIPLEWLPPDYVRAVLSEARKFSPFDRSRIEVRLIRMQKIVTPQLQVNLSRVPRLPDSGRFDETEGSKLALPLHHEVVEIPHRSIKTGPWKGEELFVAEDEDVRVQTPPEFRRVKEIEGDETSGIVRAAVFPVLRGQPFVSVWRVPVGAAASRLVITNGIHRAYGLAASGWEWLPAVFLETVRINPRDPIADMRWEHLLSPAAPLPMLSDFLNSELTFTVECDPVAVGIKLRWEYEARRIPLDRENPWDWV